MIKGLHHVCIGVRDLDQATKFCTEVLGFEFARKIEVKGLKFPLIHLKAGKLIIELRYVSESEVDGLRHISIKVDEVDPAVARLKEKGIEFIQERPPFFKDPHGVLIEVNK